MKFITRSRVPPLVAAALGCAAMCQGACSASNTKDGGFDGSSRGAGHLPLTLVDDRPLPGRSTRFDYQDVDTARGQLVVAHMNDGEVLIVDLRDGSVLARLTGIPTARGVVVAAEAGRIFATSSPNQLV